MIWHNTPTISKHSLYTAGPQKFLITLFSLILVFLQACNSTKDYYKIPTKASETTFNAVIEIPSGTNKKYEYDPSQKKFVVDTENGIDRVIDFLPYPGNYGFIPSTLSKSETGGDGDALDVLVLSETTATGTVMEIIPIAILRLIDDGEKDYKIIAVPKEESKRIIKATSYVNLTKDYPALIEIAATWFLSYNPKDSSSVEGWGDEKEALKEIERHLKN